MRGYLIWRIVPIDTLAQFVERKRCRKAKPALDTADKNKKITHHMGKAGLEPINPRRIEGPPRTMQPKSLQKAKRVASVLK